MQCISAKSSFFSNPEFFNVSSRINFSARVPCKTFENEEEFILDDYYGEIIRKDDYRDKFVYTDVRKHQQFLPPAKSYFYLPHKRVPIYECDSIEKINRYISVLQCSDEEKILYRGQTRTYSIDRNVVEKYVLYGDLNGVEPSFLTSGCRKGFDDKNLRAFWNYIGGIVANDLVADHSRSRSDLNDFVTHPKFDMFSYGIAQHYGLPSVGLDLTDDLNNALWFASNNYSIINGKAEIKGLQKDDEPILFVFKFPVRAVSEYRATKPAFASNISRPDRQNAWFAHVGWGHAKNQAALFLEMALKIPPLNVTTKQQTRFLFPSKEEDEILKIILDLKKKFAPSTMSYKILEGLYEFD